MSCFLQLLIPDEEQHYIPVPAFDIEDADTVLDQWLHHENRTLTRDQKDMVLTAFNSCPSPLFLNLCFDQACSWTSYALPTETILQSTVRDMINTLFESVEKTYGKTLVARVLGYITISKH